MNGIQERLSSLSPTRRALYERRLRGEAGSRHNGPEIKRQPTTDYPLTPEQEHVWLIDQISESAFYLNISHAYRLEGELDVRVLEDAINEIIRRHDNLRTIFPQLDGRPFPIVIPSLTLSLAKVDMSHIHVEQQQLELKPFLREAICQPFDVMQGPLIRGTIVKLGEHEHALLVTIHHILTDRLSYDIFAHELAVLYKAFSEGVASPLQELPVQYSDYAKWLSEWLESDAAQTQREFWKKRLARPTRLDLLTDRRRPAMQTLGAERVYWRLEGEIWDKFKTLSRAQDVTRFTVFLALYAVILRAQTGKEDILIGVPVSSRKHTQTQGIIGYFLNTLVFRIDLSGNPTFADCLQRARAVSLETMSHPDLPFESLFQELGIQREPGRSPLIETAFAYTNDKLEPASLALDLKISTLDPFYQSSWLDISFGVNDSEEGANLYLDYNVDLFDRETIESMMMRLRNAISEVVVAPGNRLSDLPLMDDQELAELQRWSGSNIGASGESCVHALFEEQTRSNPDAKAISFDGASLTYRELNRRANQLAHYLRTLGIGPDVRVALCLERSLEMIVAMLAVLKAGGAYVPLDPGYPMDRLIFMLQDCSPAALLTRGDLLTDLPDVGDRFPILKVEESILWDDKPETDPDRSSIQLTPHHLAYLIYTSGSTGNPKGVMVEHRNVSRLFSSTRASFQFRQTDVWTLFHSYAFDFSVWEVFGALLSGARLVIVSKDTARSAGEFYRLICEEEVTILNQTPSAFRQLIAAQALDGMPHNLRYVIFGGEALEEAALTPWYEQNQQAATRLVNMYGITETTVHVTFRLIERGDIERAGGSLIGRRISDLSIHILDGFGQPVPIGVAGELHVGEAGVARGYLNRPDLTAERFLPDLFATNKNARMYRSGDIGRWRRDGSIEFLGRNDFQVKIRGFRIELREIEIGLIEHPGIRDAVVLAREDSSVDKRLVAYYIAANPNDSGIGPGVLRAYLAARLPEYMIPGAFVRIESFPLTSNGKLDQEALPQPQPTAYAAHSYEPPHNETEDLIAEIYAEVLDLPRVGVNDDFFDLGGHSLLATQVISRLQTRFDCHLPMRLIFEAPSVAALSERVTTQLQKKTAKLFPIPCVDHNVPQPLSHAQRRLWFLNRLSPESAYYNVPSAFRLRGVLDRMLLERSLREVMRRHAILRTTFRVIDDSPVQVIEELRDWRLETEQLMDQSEQAREEQLAEIIHRESEHIFRLETGPLIRVRLVRLRDDEHILIVVMHHIVTDGWSISILFNELASIYQSLLDDTACALVPLPIQYVDWSVWQERWMNDSGLEPSLSYWRKELEGAPSVLNLPLDRPRPSLQSWKGASHSVWLPPNLCEKLNAVARGEGTTLFMVLLGAFQVLLARYSGQQDILVGTPIAGRTRKEVEPLIGFFANTLVLRGRVSGRSQIAEFLAETRKTALNGYAHQDLPFERLVEELHPERVTGQNPIFQALFVFQNTPPLTASLPGLSLSALPIPSHGSRFDLELSVGQHDGGLSAFMNYSMDLFESVTIERMMSYFQSIVSGFAANPSGPIWGLSNSRQEQEELACWNRTRRVFEKQGCMHEIFSAQAKVHPDAIAVVFGDACITYGELDRRSQHLARRLRKRHFVGPEAVVGICMERSTELIVALLGVLRAGGAYLPLDPANPEDRLSYMVRDSRSRLILTSDIFEHLFRKDEIETLVMSGWTEEPEMEFGEIVTGVERGNPAYVIYTSGSTGRPKGVIVPHAGIVNRLLWMQEKYKLSLSDRVLQKTPISFDVSVWELFWPLLNGGELVLARPDGHKDPSYLANLISERELTVAHFVPSMLEVFLSQNGMEGCASLERVFCSGEALSPDLARRFLQQSTAELHNLYGPTEASIEVSSWQCLPGDESVPIGEPIANVQLWVLDAEMQNMPVRASGELCIGGVGLARGYVDRPDLTAERFVPDPFSTEPGGRLYRTGDLARWRGDGALEFLGRMDNQVKIRGFRVEPGEIEAVLRAHVQVRDAAVVARQDDGDGLRLVGYIVPQCELAEFSEKQVRAHVREQLPEYMVPSAFVTISELPLTGSGKLDRNKLPAPAKRRADQHSYAPPQTDLERTLASLWNEVLGTKSIGMHDNFFDAGGHSLLLVKLHARLTKELALNFPLLTLFEYPTVDAFSRYLKTENDQPLEMAADKGSRRRERLNTALLRSDRAH